MLKIIPSTKFRRDLKRAVRRGCSLSLLETVIDLLASGHPLPAKYRDHALIGTYPDCRECHITPDWLLVYRLDNHHLTLILMRTGTHSDLF